MLLINPLFNTTSTSPPVSTALSSGATLVESKILHTDSSVKGVPILQTISFTSIVSTQSSSEIPIVSSLSSSEVATSTTTFVTSGGIESALSISQELSISIVVEQESSTALVTQLSSRQNAEATIVTNSRVESISSLSSLPVTLPETQTNGLLIFSTSSMPLEPNTASPSLVFSSSAASRTENSFSNGKQISKESSAGMEMSVAVTSSSSSLSNPYTQNIATSSMLGNLSFILPKKSASATLPALLSTPPRTITPLVESTSSAIVSLSENLAESTSMVLLPPTEAPTTPASAVPKAATAPSVSIIPTASTDSKILIPTTTIIPSEINVSSMVSTLNLVETQSVTPALSAATSGSETPIGQNKPPSITYSESSIINPATIASMSSALITSLVSNSAISPLQSSGASVAIAETQSSEIENLLPSALTSDTVSAVSRITGSEFSAISTAPLLNIFHSRTLSLSSTRYGNLSITFGVVPASSSTFSNAVSSEIEIPPQLASSIPVSQAQSQATTSKPPIMTSVESLLASASISIILEERSALSETMALSSEIPMGATSTLEAISASTSFINGPPSTLSEIHMILSQISLGVSSQTEQLPAVSLAMSSSISAQYPHSSIPESASSLISPAQSESLPTGSSSIQTPVPGLSAQASATTSILISPAAFPSAASAIPPSPLSTLAITLPQSTMAQPTSTHGLFNTMSKWYNTTRNARSSSVTAAALTSSASNIEPMSPHAELTTAIAALSISEFLVSTSITVSTSSEEFLLTTTEPALSAEVSVPPAVISTSPEQRAVVASSGQTTSASPLSRPTPLSPPTSPSAVPGHPVLWTTSTIYTTVIHTITSCPPVVTNCPIGSKTTQVISLTTTVYPITQAPPPGPEPWTTSTVYTAITFTITSCPPQITDCPLGRNSTISIPVYTTSCPPLVQHSPPLAEQSRPPMQPPLPPDSPPDLPLANPSAQSQSLVQHPPERSQVAQPSIVQSSASMQFLEATEIIGILVTIVVDIIVDITMNEGLTTTTYITEIFYSDTTELWNTATLGQPCYPCQISSANHSCPSSGVTITRTLCRSSPGIAPSPYTPPVVHTCASCSRITLTSGFQPPIYTNIEGSRWSSQSSVTNYTTVHNSTSYTFARHNSTTLNSTLLNSTYHSSMPHSSTSPTTTPGMPISGISTPQSGVAQTAVPQQAASLQPTSEQPALETDVPQSLAPEDMTPAKHEIEKAHEPLNAAVPSSPNVDYAAPIHPFPDITQLLRSKSGAALLLSSGVFVFLSVLVGVYFLL
ncbi:hypothetical protein EG329_011455 [Mollisiaceae sp. DMI_Dod_QoI]|nr:hypothetical protein EG329_011455 [Helotiales sp. DMI_Dod_QoI]